MKHSPKLYAKALAEVAAGPLSEKQERAIIQNFTRLLTTRVGRGQWPKFIAAAEKALREKAGLRKVTITSARPLKETKQEFHKILKSSDIIEKKVDPELVAGVKLTINDSRQFDGSLRAKLNKLF